MSELTKQALKVENNQSFPNNNAGLITPSALRTFNEDMIDSTVSQIQYTADSASFDARINAITGSGGTTNTGSLLLTASFASQNLTFTKGDGSQFSLFIPDNSGSVLPSGVVSGSSQINYPQISNIPSGIVSGAAQVTPLLPTGTVSGSSQIILQQTTGLLSGSRIDGAVTSSLTASIANEALDVIVNARNNTGAQINKGTIVRIIGATGDEPLIQTASWDNDSTSANTLGWVQNNIPNGEFGKVITQGTLLGVNTNPALGYTPGQILYLSSSGQYTNVIPPAPYHEVRLGQVLRAQQNNGSVFVQIQNGYELSELHDVNITTASLANNQVLAYNSASGQWVNQSLNGLGFATTGSNTFIGNQIVSGSVDIQSTLTASLQQGYVWVGNELNRTVSVPTSSFGGGGTGNGFPFSGSAVITGSLSVSETVKSQVYMNPQTLDGFTIPTGNNAMLVGPVAISGSLIVQGNSKLIVLDQVSGSGGGTTINTGSFATTGSNVFRGNQVITGSLRVSESVDRIVLQTFEYSNFNPTDLGGVVISSSLSVTGDTRLGGAVRFGQLGVAKIVKDQAGAIPQLAIVSDTLFYNDADINIAPKIGISGSLFVSQSIHVGEAVRIKPSNPLPITGSIGTLAVSGSSLYFYDGTWRQVSLI